MKMRLETYKMAASIFLKFLTLKCDISRTNWRIEVSDGSLFCIFHALSFELNLFFDRTCPLKVGVSYHQNERISAKSAKLLLKKAEVPEGLRNLPSPPFSDF